MLYEIFCAVWHMIGIMIGASVIAAILGEAISRIGGSKNDVK